MFLTIVRLLAKLDPQTGDLISLMFLCCVALSGPRLGCASRPSPLVIFTPSSPQLQSTVLHLLPPWRCKYFSIVVPVIFFWLRLFVSRKVHSFPPAYFFQITRSAEGERKRIKCTSSPLVLHLFRSVCTPCAITNEPSTGHCPPHSLIDSLALSCDATRPCVSIYLCKKYPCVFAVHTHININIYI